MGVKVRLLGLALLVFEVFQVAAIGRAAGAFANHHDFIDGYASFGGLFQRKWEKSTSSKLRLLPTRAFNSGITNIRIHLVVRATTPACQACATPTLL